MEPGTAESLLSASPTGLMIIDASGVMTWASPSVRTLTGYEPDEIIGTSILTYLHETAVQGILESVAYVTEHSEAVMGPASMAFYHSDGDIRILEAYAVNRFADPAVEGLVAAVRDVTVQYVTNAALQSYTEGAGLEAALAEACSALRGLPIQGQAALIEPGSGRVLANAGLPVELLTPVPGDAASGPWHQACATGLATLPEDLSGFDATVRGAAEEAGLVTIWAIPLADAGRADAVLVRGESVGSEVRACLVIGRIEHGEPTINERYTMALSTRAIGLMMEREDLVAEIDRAARIDSLTGLSNRSHLFRERSPDQATAGRVGGGDVAVLYIDLDGFKPINDQYGHAAGDAVLAEVAQRMRLACREGDELGRMGGDEFLMLCWNVLDAGQATAVADRILELLAEPIALPTEDGGHTVVVGASIGVALSARVVEPATATGSPDGESLDDVIRRADVALYEAKRSGRNRWSLAAAAERPSGPAESG